MGKFDYSAFQDFSRNFMKFEAQFSAWLASFLIKEGMKFIRAVKPRTPVDTGALRGAWSLDGVSRRGDDILVWFVNPMNYATFVEYGHAKPYKSGAGPGSPDWVDGYFMMTVSLDEINRKMPRAFEAAFKKWIKSLGVN